MMTNEQTALLPQNRYALPRSRGRKCRSVAIVAIIICVVSVCTVLSLRWRRASVPDFIDHEFGVGFHLTSPYGTAAISYPNGTTVNVANIDASYPYQEMMSRLSLDSSRHFHGTYNSLDDWLHDWPRLAVRRVRKAAGLPASSDVGRLAQLIADLRFSIEKHVGQKISGATATIPHLAALYDEDLEDAFEYAGLIYIPHYPYWYGGILGETGAVYMANIFESCSNHTDPDISEDTKRNLPPDHLTSGFVLSVSYTRSMLTSTKAFGSTCYASYDNERPARADLNLGWDNRDTSPGQKDYWAAVRDTIIYPVLEENRNIHEETDSILLHGESAVEEQFQTVVKKAVEDVLQRKVEIFVHDPLYSAVRGAAEMARRVYWHYNHTGSNVHCMDCEV